MPVLLPNSQSGGCSEWEGLEVGLISPKAYYYVLKAKDLSLRKSDEDRCLRPLAARCWRCVGGLSSLHMLASLPPPRVLSDNTQQKSSPFCNLSRDDEVKFYCRRKVLQISTGIDQMGSVKWDLTLCLLLAWIVVYFCIWKGVKSSGKVIKLLRGHTGLYLP